MDKDNDQEQQQPKKVTAEEREGIDMLHSLNSLDGVIEPQSVLLKEWREMSPGEKQKIRLSYKRLLETRR